MTTLKKEKTTVLWHTQRQKSLYHRLQINKRYVKYWMSRHDITVMRSSHLRLIRKLVGFVTTVQYLRDFSAQHGPLQAKLLLVLLVRMVVLNSSEKNLSNFLFLFNVRVVKLVLFIFRRIFLVNMSQQASYSSSNISILEVLQFVFEFFQTLLSFSFALCFVIVDGFALKPLECFRARSIPSCTTWESKSETDIDTLLAKISFATIVQFFLSLL